MVQATGLKVTTICAVAAMAVCGCGTEPSGVESSAQAAEPKACSARSSFVGAFWVGEEGDGSEAASEQTLGGNVWTLTADKTLEQLTVGGTAAQPWMNGDASAVYFTRSGNEDLHHSYEVWKSDIATREETLLYRLADHPGQVLSPEASPTGQEIVFAMASGEDFRTRIVTVESASGTLAEYSHPDENGFSLNDEPTYSTDGRHIAYIRDLTTEDSHVASVRIVDVESREDRQLYVADEGSTLNSLEWSPDGTRMLVTEVGRTADDNTVSGQALSINSSSGDATVLASDVVTEATYSSLDGSRLSADGLTLDQHRDDTRSHDAGLITWRDGEVELYSLKPPLRNAQGLSLADCSLATPGGLFQ